MDECLNRCGDVPHEGRRTNGWDKPFNPLQKASWFLFVVFISTAYPLCFGYLEPVARVVLGVIYVIATLAVGKLTHYCTSYDPADSQFAGETDHTDVYKHDEGEHVAFCYACSHVVKPRSRHCRICEKCVDVFDHHCKWLNNCVGAGNYRQFVGLLFTSFIMTGLQGGVGIYIFIEFLAVDRASFVNSLAGAVGCSVEGSGDTCAEAALAPELFIVLSLIVTVILTGTAIMIAQLATFHSQLIREGITTYDYIARKGREMAERRRMERLGMSPPKKPLCPCGSRPPVVPPPPPKKTAEREGAAGAESAAAAGGQVKQGHATNGESATRAGEGNGVTPQAAASGSDDDAVVDMEAYYAPSDSDDVETGDAAATDGSAGEAKTSHDEDGEAASAGIANEDATEQEPAAEGKDETRSVASEGSVDGGGAAKDGDQDETAEGDSGSLAADATGAASDAVDGVSPDERRGSDDSAGAATPTDVVATEGASRSEDKEVAVDDASERSGSPEAKGAAVVESASAEAGKDGGKSDE